jgi:hypothetical protein
MQRLVLEPHPQQVVGTGQGGMHLAQPLDDLPRPQTTGNGPETTHVHQRIYSNITDESDHTVSPNVVRQHSGTQHQSNTSIERAGGNQSAAHPVPFLLNEIPETVMVGGLLPPFTRRPLPVSYTASQNILRKVNRLLERGHYTGTAKVQHL